MIKNFPLSDVRLLESPFKKAQDADMRYIMEMDVDRLLSPYRRESGLPTKAESYTNWESTGLDGHIAGHYLSALSLMYSSTEDSSIKDRLDYMIGELELCQEANGNGYIGGVPEGMKMWEDVKKGNLKAARFELNGKWVPLYNIHKMFAGLRDAWQLCHNTKAKNMLIKFSDWMLDIAQNLSHEQMQDMLRSEHGGLNEVFADVYEITGNKKYLDLAIKFCDESILNPLIDNKDKLTGLHANTQLPKIIGFKRISELNGNKDYENASRFFWETVVNNRTICIGGNSVREHFHPIDDFSSMLRSEQGVETCNTYNMLRLTKMLYATDRHPEYVDYYERALYNHILSSQNPENGGLVYFTQMRPEHYRVYSQPHTSMWCCVGTGLENHAKYGEFIYATDDKNLFVNLFIPSSLNWDKKGVSIKQINNFPQRNTTNLYVSCKKPANFTIYLRVPQWTENPCVKINGKEIDNPKSENGYIGVSKTWEEGDTIEYILPMKITSEYLPDNSSYVAYLYGPIVLAAKTGAIDLKGLYADDSRMGHVAKGEIIPMKDIPILVADKGNELEVISKTNKESLDFTLKSLYVDNDWHEYALEPFYNIHASRYIIYWPTSTVQQLDSIKESIENDERKLILLNESTEDVIYCGQQQPESDHFIEHQNSSTGYTEGMHWRVAKDWFGYKLNNRNKAKAIYLKYLDSKKKRNTAIEINGEVVKNIILENGKDDEMKETIIDITDRNLTTGQVSLRIVGSDNKSTMRIVEIRLLNNVPDLTKE